MAKCLTTLLLWSLMLIQSIPGEDCPSTCETTCTAADNGCSTCKPGYFGRKCQYPLQCVTGIGRDYHGTISITENGRNCQMWNSQSPNKHSIIHLPENYCRNQHAANEPKPWCYNGEGTNPRFEYCNIPSCDTHCPVPPLNVFGDIPNPPLTGFQVGVTVSVIAGCGPGTTGKRTCKSDKTWADALNCTRIKWCPKPTMKTRSFIDNNQDEYYFDTELVVICVTGYEIAGSTNKIKCQGDKSWGTTPDCTKVQCPPPVLNENSVIKNPQSPYEYGDTITIGCKAGYTVSGQNTFTCQVDKTWSGTMPRCQPVPCQDLNLNAHSSIQSGKTSFVYGDTVTIVCNQGYTVKGQGTLNCQSNGQWNGQPPTCEPVPCPLPTLPAYISIVNPKTNFVFADKIQLKCDEGLESNSVNEITCQANKTWTKIPACTAVKCSKPIIPKNGIISFGEQTEYVYRDSVVISCSTGFSLQGNNTMMCYDKGLWIGTGWRCIAVTDEENENVAYLMIGVAVGVAGLLFVGAIVFIVVYIRRRKHIPAGTTSSTTEGGDKDAGEDYINLGSDISGDTTNTNTNDVIGNRDPEHIYNELK